MVEIDAHQVGPGQPLLKVTDAGPCRSDEFVMGLKKIQLAFPMPFKLGHERAETVEAPAEGMQNMSVGMRTVRQVCTRQQKLLHARPGRGNPSA